MARLESVALGGFYPTPPHLVPLLAAHVRRELPPPPERYSYGRRDLAMLDPCAGEGGALAGLAEGLEPERVHLYAIELETTRAKACAKALGPYRGSVLAGDAFRATCRSGGRSGAGLLYLNPPYDQDRDFQRLEARFLHRFTPALAVGGILVFVVPHYALAASSEHLGLHYEDVAAYRFPGADFDAFKQVVLFARRVDARLAPCPVTAAYARAWSTDASLLEELALPDGDPAYEVPTCGYDGAFEEWLLRAVDMTALLGRHRPWHVTRRAGALEPLTDIVPAGGIEDSLLRFYPVATLPRPAHIAAGISAGIFNGARITPVPAAEARGLPPLLVKGVFDREYKTVDTKVNKDGDEVGQVQVQQPKLVTTVLDLTAGKFHKLGEGVVPTGTSTPSLMNVADLLVDYGPSLMAAMRAQCPTLYDPARDADAIALCPSPRSPFTAQAHAVRALVTLLREPDQTAILLGEIGSGKSTVSVLAARTHGAERILVLCPPHLLDSWRNEAAAVAPELAVHVLETVEDLDRLPKKGEGPFLAILSREAAKLSHGIEAVPSTCPKCGAGVPEGDLAKKRARCEAQDFHPQDTVARAARELAVHLTAHSHHATIPMVLRGRFDAVRFARQARAERETYTGPPPAVRAALGQALARMAARYEGAYQDDASGRAILLLAHALDDPEWTAMAVACVLERPSYNAPDFARSLALLLPSDHPAHDARSTEHRQHHAAGAGRSEYLKELAEGKAVKPYALGATLERRPDGAMLVDGCAPGSLEALERALDKLAHVGRWGLSPSCGEPLYQAVPEPRRVSLAKHITRYHKGAFDFVILDECHEYATEGSAQERAGHRLSGLRVPTIHMTGSVMNGYAVSLFMTMWSVSSDFRREFKREDKGKFVDRFGYRKRLLEDRRDGKVVEFGSQTDRVVRSEKILGDAPGVLPLFVLRHLLRVSVTLHKADLAIELPACRQVRHKVQPSKKQFETYQRLLDALVRQIKADLWQEGMAGKLFGQLAEIPSYLDRATADVGNTEDGRYAVRYPESLDSKVVAEAEGLPPSTILPKEQWMLDLVRAELAAGRHAMVFSWHLSVLPRLARLLEAELGEPAPILYADKVPTAKRQAWIDREIVKKKRRIMLANPVAIQTGLNNLVHFATEVWMENPACNPLTVRQAIGRVDRIGQLRETRIHFPVYEGTLQEACYELLMRKVAVSTATDGLDPEAALSAAGLGSDDALAGLSIGKQLWKLLGEGAEGAGAAEAPRTKRAKAA